MVLQAPLPRTTHRALRAVVLEHRESERGRRFPPTLHVGAAGRSHVHVERPGLLRHDPGLRTDICLALLQRALREAPGPWVWLTRPGDLNPQDVDLAWSSAVHHAAASLDLSLGLLVVTRQGWRDPASGMRHEWRRLRRQSGGPPPA